MIRRSAVGRVAAFIGLGVVLAAPFGCGEGPPAVDSSTAKATVHGVVTFGGGPLSGGEIRFDPSNIKRKDAQIATAVIEKDGTYEVTTLQGANVVRFEFPPAVLKKYPQIASYSKEYDAPGGDSTFDVDIEAPK